LLQSTCVNNVFPFGTPYKRTSSRECNFKKAYIGILAIYAFNLML